MNFIDDENKDKNENNDSDKDDNMFKMILNTEHILLSYSKLLALTQRVNSTVLGTVDV